MSVNGDIDCAGSAEIAALIYAPHGGISLSGSADVHGAVIGEEVDISGSRTITYSLEVRDRDGMPGRDEGGVGGTTLTITSWQII